MRFDKWTSEEWIERLRNDWTQGNAVKCENLLSAAHCSSTQSNQVSTTKSSQRGNSTRRCISWQCSLRKRPNTGRPTWTPALDLGFCSALHLLATIVGRIVRGASWSNRSGCNIVFERTTRRTVDLLTCLSLATASRPTRPKISTSPCTPTETKPSSLTCYILLLNQHTTKFG